MDYVNLVSAVGFPIVMCFYLVIRMEKTIKENTKAINNLKETIISKK